MLLLLHRYELNREIDGCIFKNLSYLFINLMEDKEGLHDEDDRVRTWKSRAKVSRRLGFEQGEERMVSIISLEREKKKLQMKKIYVVKGGLLIPHHKKKPIFLLSFPMCGPSLWT
jgi:hypothetical protein